MPSMNVEVPHTLGQAEATNRLRDFIERVKAKYEGKVSNVTAAWNENVLDFSFTTFGFTIPGQLTVEGTLARVTGDLPFAAMFFQGQIEQSIRDELAKALRPAT